MNLKFNEENLLEWETEPIDEISSIMVVSKTKGVTDSELKNVIQIVDEAGDEVHCTYDKFVEIFDQEGLSGFII